MSTYRPPVRRSQKMRARLVASIAAVIVAAGLLWLVVDFASERPDEVNLGDDTFEVGKAERLADDIAEGGPFLFKDPLTRRAGRELYLQHLGRDPDEGWVAIEAYAPGAAREIRCILRWDAADEEFVDPCGDESFPPGGEGLTTYPAEVDDDGVVVVDLRRTG